MNLAGFITLLRRTFDEWQKDNAARLAAALAFYTIFSLAPLLIIVIGLAGFIIGQEAAQGEVLAQVQSALGDEAPRVSVD